jgi:2-oxoglutarate ferredoxin oxidoreductase subunit delta
LAENIKNMAKVRGAVVVNKEGCKGCALCVEACPEDVLALNKDVNSRGYHYSYMENPEACIGCANCGVVCPDTCITIYRVKV